MLKMFLCLLLLLTPPAFQIDGLSVGMNEVELELAMKGKPFVQIDAELRTYNQGTTLVRVVNGRVVSVGGAVLGRDNTPAAMATRAQVLEQLGKPGAVMRSERSEMLIYLVPSADLGVLMNGDQVAGFMLNEPGTLQHALRAVGYK